MNDEGTMILALASEWHTDRSVLIDASCGHRCWIGPESKTHVDNNPGIETSCLLCAGLSTEELLGGEVEVKAVPGQRKVLDELWGKENTKKAFDRLGIKDEE